MAWKRNKKLVREGFRDLEHLPPGRSEWDATLACLAFGMRMDIERRPPDLNAWAARHGVPGSGRYEEFGPDALVLWHGTSSERAEKIAEHGLFHKKGVWTALHPSMPHSFCRGRSERFGVDGAVVCLVFDGAQLAEGGNYDIEGKGNVYRFHHGLPPKVVEYVLVHEGISFVGERRTRGLRPWPAARFKKRSGRWLPVQKPPVRHGESRSYSSSREFAGICADRLLEELGELTALEVFSCVYSCAAPRDAVEHQDLFDIIEEKCVPHRQRGKWQTFRARGGD